MGKGRHACARRWKRRRSFVLATILRCRAGGIMITGGTHSDLTNLLATAVAGVKNLIEQDRG